MNKRAPKAICRFLGLVLVLGLTSACNEGPVYIVDTLSLNFLIANDFDPGTQRNASGQSCEIVQTEPEKTSIVIENYRKSSRLILLSPLLERFAPKDIAANIFPPRNMLVADLKELALSIRNLAIKHQLKRILCLVPAKGPIQESVLQAAMLNAIADNGSMSFQIKELPSMDIVNLDPNFIEARGQAVLIVIAGPISDENALREISAPGIKHLLWSAGKERPWSDCLGSIQIDWNAIWNQQTKGVENPIQSDQQVSVKLLEY